MMTPEVEAYIGPIMANAGRYLNASDLPPGTRLAALVQVDALRQRILRAAAAGPGTVDGLPQWIHDLKAQQDSEQEHDQ